MPQGGKREGAGRPKGSVSKLDEEARKVALASGVSPLDYMLGVMRDEAADEAKRLDAAKAAAPYCHARLSSVEVAGPGGGPVETVSRYKLAPLE